MDRRFQEKVWSWLTKNPEVSVGRSKEGNHLTLTEVEGLAASAAPTQPVINPPAAEASNYPPGDENKKPTQNGPEPLRVFVSKERTWLAITGHEPDETKIFPTEFALLSVIASSKYNGVSQPDLARFTGQDKRSIPRRTDELQRKGYIDKRPIQIKGTRTSLCTLRRFVRGDTASRALETTPAGAAGEMYPASDMIDFKSFLDKLFEALREYKLISRIDLRQVLGFNDKWRWKTLARTVRKFERIGVLKRVKAMSQYSGTKGTFHSCILLVREPSERDFTLFHDYGRSLFATLKQPNGMDLDEENEDPDPDDATGEPASLGHLETANIAKREEHMEEAGRTLPTWSPDRSIRNQVFEIIHGAGTKGMVSRVSFTQDPLLREVL